MAYPAYKQLSVCWGYPPRSPSDYLGRRTLDTTPWPPNLAWHCARSAVRFFALMRLVVWQFAALHEHLPITSARLAEGITSAIASVNRDARTQPRLRAI
jgi:hypothetical protein